MSVLYGTLFLSEDPPILLLHRENLFHALHLWKISAPVLWLLWINHGTDTRMSLLISVSHIRVLLPDKRHHIHTGGFAQLNI